MRRGDGEAFDPALAADLAEAIADQRADVSLALDMRHHVHHPRHFGQVSRHGGGPGGGDMGRTLRLVQRPHARLCRGLRP